MPRPQWKVFIKKNANGELEAEPGIIRPRRNQSVGFYSRDIDVVICFDSYTCFGLHRYRIPKSRGIILDVSRWAPNIEVYYEILPGDLVEDKTSPSCNCLNVDWREYAFDMMEEIDNVAYDENLPWRPQGDEYVLAGDLEPRARATKLGKPRNP